MAHSESFRVRSSEVDTRERLTPRALCAYLQEAAGLHAAMLGASMARLREEGLAWVLHRLRVDVDDLPRLGDTVEVLTWPSRFDRVVAERLFVVRDEAGQRLAAAASRWAVADLRQRKPVRIPEFIRQIGVETGPVRVALDRALPTPVTRADVTKSFAVRRSDLDVVGHVNNTHYVDWLLETVPDEVRSARQPVQFDVVFQREALYGDVVASEAERLDGAGGDAFRHVLRHEGDRGELVRAFSIWV